MQGTTVTVELDAPTESSRTLSKHLQEKFVEQREYLDRVLIKKQNAGMYVEKEDISIEGLMKRWDAGMIVNWDERWDNRDPEKTWNDHKRSLFVGDLFSGNAMKPNIILWKDINASYDSADNVMDGQNRYHAIVKVSMGTIPIIIGHANGKAYWMPPPGVDNDDPAQPSTGAFKCFLSPWQIKAFYDHTKVVLLEWKNCDFEMANVMARNLNR